MPSIQIPFEASKISLIVLSEDPNKPYLLVLPGGPGMPAELYEPASEFCSEWCNVVIIDPPGCGLSQGYSPETLDMEQYIRVIETVQQHFKQEHLQLFGTSYGAMVAFDYMSRFPDRVSKTFTVGGAFSYHFLEQAKANLKRMGTPEQIEICDRWLWKGTMPAPESAQEYFQIMGPLYSTSWDPDSGTNYANVNCSVDALNNGFGSDFWHFDLTPRLSNTSCDVLAMWGEVDWVNDPSLADELLKYLPNAQALVIEGAGHSVAKDQTDEFRRLVSEFLAK